MAETGTPKGKLDLQYLALGFTIIGGIIALITYIEQTRYKKLQEENAMLEREIKKKQLEKLKKA
jgi:formate dehydrogenase assembly factor FdhD